jgi:hypothetical protein
LEDKEEEEEEQSCTGVQLRQRDKGTCRKAVTITSLTIVAYQASRRVVWCEASHPRATFRPTISSNSWLDQTGAFFSIARPVCPFLPLPRGSHLRGGTFWEMELRETTAPSSATKRPLLEASEIDKLRQASGFSRCVGNDPPTVLVSENGEC